MAMGWTGLTAMKGGLCTSLKVVFVINLPDGLSELGGFLQICGNWFNLRNFRWLMA